MWVLKYYNISSEQNEICLDAEPDTVSQDSAQFLRLTNSITYLHTHSEWNLLAAVVSNDKQFKIFISYKRCILYEVE